MSNGSGSAQISPLMGLSPSPLSPLSLYLGVKNSGVVTAFVTLSAYHRHRRPHSAIRLSIDHCSQLVRLPLHPFIRLPARSVFTSNALRA